MGSDFDSFDQSPLGAFLQSPLGERGGGKAKQVHLGIAGFATNNDFLQSVVVDGTDYYCLLWSANNNFHIVKTSRDLGGIAFTRNFSGSPTTSGYMLGGRVIGSELIVSVSIGEGTGDKGSVIVRFNKSDGSFIAAQKIDVVCRGFLARAAASYFLGGWLNGEVLCLDDSSVLWSASYRDSTNNHAVYEFADDGTSLYFIHIDDTAQKADVVKIDPANGDILWAKRFSDTARGSSNSASGIAVQAGVVYVVFNRDEGVLGPRAVFAAMDAATGALIYAKRLNELLPGHPPASQHFIGRPLALFTNHAGIVVFNGPVFLNLSNGSFAFGNRPTVPFGKTVRSNSINNDDNKKVLFSCYSDIEIFNPTWDGQLFQLAYPPETQTYTVSVTDAGSTLSASPVTKGSASATRTVFSETGAAGDYQMEATEIDI